MKSKVFVMEESGLPKIKGTHYDTVIVDDPDDPANSKGAVERGEFMDCPGCFNELFGAMMGMESSLHSATCYKKLEQACDEAAGVEDER